MKVRATILGVLFGYFLTAMLFSQKTGAYNITTFKSVILSLFEIETPFETKPRHGHLTGRI